MAGARFGAQLPMDHVGGGLRPYY
eukprot:SAG31_NODE_26232_length_446_cov_0.596542_1_plen_23_part_01